MRDRTANSVLVISDLHVSVHDKVFLKGLDLTVRSGEVHAIMGPNGVGKSTLSHVLMGKPGYEITGGTITLDGVDLLAMPTHERAHAGLYLFSGGEKKRNETLQLAVLQPKFAILDVDALRLCSRRVEQATQESGLGVIAITHYKCLLAEMRPDFVHVLAKGRIQRTGDASLADELDETGYREWAESEVVAAPAPFAGFGDDPFADPLR